MEERRFTSLVFKVFRPARFEEPLETAYREASVSRDTAFLRGIAGLGIVTQAIRFFSESHSTLAPDGTVNAVRLAITLLSLSLIILSFQAYFRRHFGIIMIGGTVIASALALFGNLRNPGGMSYGLAVMGVYTLYYSTYTLSAATVSATLATGLAVPGLVGVYNGMPWERLIGIETMMLLVVTVTLAAAGTFDRQRRRSFRVERDLAASHETLRRAHDSLRAAQDELVQVKKMAALGRLVTGVAHEINTPVGNILTVASHLEEATRPLTAALHQGQLRKAELARFLDEVTEVSRVIVGSAQQAAKLVTTFKLVAVESDGAKRRPIDLALALPDIMAGLAPLHQDGACTLRIDCPPSLCVDGCPSILETILAELLKNAVAHAFPAGEGGALAVSARSIGNRRVEVRFADDGRGIAAELLPFIFDPFFTTDRKGGATGLGLPIVYNAVVGRLNGSIAVESREGEGTTFIIQLPAATAHGP